MTWFRREPAIGPDPIDALLARNLAAQERAAKAADGVAQAADDQADQIEATSATLRRLIAEAPDRTGRTTEVRRAVEGLLARTGHQTH